MNRTYILRLMMKKDIQSKDELQNNQPGKSFVDCENCSMEPLCVPISTENQEIHLSESYLTRRSPITNNNPLFLKGDSLTDIFAVSSGAFKLTDINDQNEEKILGFRFPGELIGEDALHPQKYNYTAIAIGDSSVCKVNTSSLKNYSALVPNLQLNLIELLNRQCYINQKEFHELISRKSAESLLAAFLLNISERKAKHDDTKDVLHLPMNRESIANFLGLRRETLSRIFVKLQKEQLIEVKSKVVHLIEADKLRELANL